MNSNTPLWQQAIILVYAAAVAGLVVWFGIHGSSLPDWLASMLGIFIGFIAHALASTNSAQASERAFQAGVNATPSSDTTLTPQASELPVQPRTGHIQIGG